MALYRRPRPVAPPQALQAGRRPSMPRT